MMVLGIIENFNKDQEANIGNRTEAKEKFFESFTKDSIMELAMGAKVMKKSYQRCLNDITIFIDHLVDFLKKKIYNDEKSTKYEIKQNPELTPKFKAKKKIDSQTFTELYGDKYIRKTKTIRMKSSSEIDDNSFHDINSPNLKPNGSKTPTINIHRRNLSNYKTSSFKTNGQKKEVTEIISSSMRPTSSVNREPKTPTYIGNKLVSVLNRPISPATKCKEKDAFSKSVKCVIDNNSGFFSSKVSPTKKRHQNFIIENGKEDAKNHYANTMTNLRLMTQSYVDPDSPVKAYNNNSIMLNKNVDDGMFVKLIQKK